jgi:predicted ribosomally synthesized peptide with SipW-like signal peptide
MAIALVGALVGGGLYAYFSDIETSAPNTFTAGTIDLMVNDQNPWTQNFTANLTDLKPCQTGYINVTLKNVGTNPMDVWKIINDANTTGGNNTYPSADPKASSEPEWQECGGENYAEVCDIDDVIRYSMTAAKISGVNDPAATATILETENFTISDGTHGLTTNAVKEQYIYLGEMAPGDVWRITQRYHMDANTTDWAQGET